MIERLARRWERRGISDLVGVLGALAFAAVLVFGSGNDLPADVRLGAFILASSGGAAGWLLSC